MKKMIPLEKRSKKEQKAWYARQRGDWNGVNPVTRVVPNKKHYDRKKQRREPFPDAVFLIASPKSGRRATDSPEPPEWPEPAL